MAENPPSYNVVTVNLPPEAEAAAMNSQPGWWLGSSSYRFRGSMITLPQP
jgi:hypothetical protein